MDLDEDSIDAETLQARIDMSLSFAQDLVSSWIKPSNNLAPRSNRNTEEELKEYMRRPPRLGVGAPIPESVNTSRDTVRLKQQLASKSSKKRAIEEVIDQGKHDDTDDGEESRANAIRKKVKIGESQHSNKRNRATSADGPNTVPTPLVNGPTVAAGSAIVDLITPEKPSSQDSEVHSANASRSKKKKKNRHASNALKDPAPRIAQPMQVSAGTHGNPPRSEIAQRAAVDASGQVPPEISTTLISTARKTTVSNAQANHVMNCPEPQRTKPPRTPERHSGGEALDISLVNTPLSPGPRNAGTPKGVSLIKGSILNLAGPLADDSDGESVSGTALENPSKKRRRRKKKKKHHDANIVSLAT